MTTTVPIYEVFAIRYARREAMRSNHFIGGDPHDGPMPMDYFIWVAKSDDHVVVIDTGFTAPVAAARQREFLRCPVETLSLLGILPEDVDDVVLTHLHYDHSGNFDRFPKATFHLQEDELDYATGKYMRYPRLAHSFEVDDVCGIVKMNYAGRVLFYDGDDNLNSSIRLHRCGGHSAGLQFVSVNTARGWLVLASDATHYYENMNAYRPFTTAFHIGEMMKCFDQLKRVAPSEDHIIPGHDPLVMRRYPALPGQEGVIVRLDVPPASQLPAAP